MNQQLSTSLDDAINRETTHQQQVSADILNRSQQKLKDLEDETKFMQGEKRKLDDSAASLREQITKLTLLLEQDVRNSIDLGVAVKANLNAIDSLRKDGVTLPE